MVILLFAIGAIMFLWSIAVCAANCDDRLYCDKCGRELKHGERCRCWEDDDE